MLLDFNIFIEIAKNQENQEKREKLLLAIANNGFSDLLHQSKTIL